MSTVLGSARVGGVTIHATAPLTLPAPAGAVTHGSQVNAANTGFVALGVTQGDLQVMRLPSRGYWRTDTPDDWSPSSPYVYDNDPANKGGVVPAGGMLIDGYQVPGGTRVVQFRDFSAGDFYVTSGQNVLMRGCRMRGPNRAPGYFNCAAGQTSKLWIGYCSMGGLGAANAEYNEVPIKVAAAGGGAVYRNHLSFTTTGVQINANGFDVVENYITDLAYFYGPNPPPGESTDKHLNGLTFNGGETAFRVLRNNITLPSPDGAGRTINQTDAISMFQDFGAFPGTGTNVDGSRGYAIADNYLGGGGVTVYAGVNAGKPQSSVANLRMTGNRITTRWWPNGGAVGPITAQPAWGSNGNAQTDNLWADGPNAGRSFI